MATKALEKVVTGASPNAWEYEVKRQASAGNGWSACPRCGRNSQPADVHVIERPEGPSHEWPYQPIYTHGGLTYGQRAELATKWFERFDRNKGFVPFPAWDRTDEPDLGAVSQDW